MIDKKATNKKPPSLASLFFEARAGLGAIIFTQQQVLRKG
ncbi:MAG: hypothetical protein ACJA2E_002367 [Arenicella sp.]|jgi:hypothetical protein